MNKNILEKIIAWVIVLAFCILTIMVAIIKWEFFLPLFLMLLFLFGIGLITRAIYWAIGKIFE